LIKEAAHRFGKQSVVASLDVKKNVFGKPVIKKNRGRQTVSMSIEQCGTYLLGLGVGELLLTSIDHDGMMTGYNYDLILRFAKLVNVPIVACGGASTVNDFVQAVAMGASAVAAGAMFYFKGSFNAVLLNYPDQRFLRQHFYSQI
jgi:cyclase